MGRRAHLRLAAAVPPAGPRLRTQARSPRGHGVLGHHHDYDKAPGQIRNRNSPGQTVGRRPQPSLTETRSTGRMTTFIYRLSDCPDLTARPATARATVDQARFGGLTALDTRRVVYGADRRAILTHSPELHESQARGFDGTTLAKAGRKLDELAATLARGKTRRQRPAVEAEIEAITRKPWVRRVITWQLDGEKPRDLRLTWGIDENARAALEDRKSVVTGK